MYIHITWYQKILFCIIFGPVELYLIILSKVSFLKRKLKRTLS